MDIQKEIDSLKAKAGYDGKPQQWQYGFDLACRELAKAQAVPDGFVLVPKEPTFRMSFAYQMNSVAPISSLSVSGYKAMLEAQEQAND